MYGLHIIFSMTVQNVAAYFKSPLGILKIVCLFTITLLVALSTYSHFNSHWTSHYRMVEREEVSTLKLREKLTEFRNEFEECRYNNRPYVRITAVEAPEKINGLGARQYESTAETSCPHPVMELFLVATSISVFIVSVISILTICVWFPHLVTEDNIRVLRIVDMILFGLATCFLFIGLVMFWYSTDNIAEWCSLKSSIVSFKSKSSRRTESDKFGIQHKDSVDFITGENENEKMRMGTMSPELLMPAKDSAGYPVVKLAGAGPPQMLYLPRVKREFTIEPQTVELKMLSLADPNDRNLNVDAFDLELQNIRENQYLGLCNMRQMTTEKYITVAVAFLAVFLHGVTIGFIFFNCGKGKINDSTVNDQEAQNRQSSASSGNSNSSQTYRELRPILKQLNNKKGSIDSNDNNMANFNAYYISQRDDNNANRRNRVSIESPVNNDRPATSPIRTRTPAPSTERKEKQNKATGTDSISFV